MELPSPSDIVNNALALLTGGIYRNDGGEYCAYKELFNFSLAENPVIWFCGVPDTNSMDPVFDTGHTNLYLRGANPGDQKRIIDWVAKRWKETGDANIMVYQNSAGSIVHRLHSVEEKNGERLWWFKGDNNAVKDPVPVRDEEITHLYIGTIL